jgi:hypothetical protein
MAAKKLFNAKYIDAEVFEVKFEFDISPKKTYYYSTESAKKFLINLEEHFFIEKTSMSNEVLLHPLKVTEFGSYGSLYEEIEDYRRNYNNGELVKKSIIFSAFSWYEHRFLPAYKVMQEEDVLIGFPHRTYTDLYVWIQKHKYYLSQKAGYDVGFDFTVQDFFKKYKKVNGLHLLPSKIKDVLHDIKEHIKNI